MAEGTDRRLGHGIVDALGGLPLFATAPLSRRWHLRWGATNDEVRGPMPGDDIVTKASFIAMRAITIDAPPEQVCRVRGAAGHPGRAAAAPPTQDAAGPGGGDLADRRGLDRLPGPHRRSRRSPTGGQGADLVLVALEPYLTATGRRGLAALAPATALGGQDDAKEPP